MAVEFVSNVYLVDHHKVIQCNIRDITRRKEAEQAQRQSEIRYRSYIEMTEQLGWTTDADGEVIEDILSWRKFTGDSNPAGTTANRGMEKRVNNKETL